MKRVDVSKRKVDANTTLLANDLNNKVTDLQFEQTNVENDRAALKHTIMYASLDIIGSTTRTNQEWFDENDNHIHDLLSEKYKLHLAHRLDPN